MPRQSTIFRWLASNPTFREQYAHAREAQADVLADEILDIADDSRGDVTIGEDGVERTNAERVARSKLRVDARKWIASKLKPKVYGDKVQTEHSGSIATPELKLILNGTVAASSAKPSVHQ